MMIKAGPESKIIPCCGHPVQDRDDVLFLESDEPDGPEYGYFCKACAEVMIKDGHARIRNGN